MGNARAQNQSRKLANIAAMQVDQRNIQRTCLLPGILVIVPGPDLGTGFDQCLCSSNPRLPQPEHRNFIAFKEEDRDHGYLSFSVARPAIASIEAMIQNRMTMVGSAQPFFSK